MNMVGAKGRPLKCNHVNLFDSSSSQRVNQNGNVSCANPLFLTWLREWQQQAKATNQQKLYFTYRKASFLCVNLSFPASGSLLYRWMILNCTTVQLHFLSFSHLLGC